MSLSKHLLRGVCCFLLLCAVASPANAQTYQELLKEGRTLLLNQTRSGAVLAKSRLQAADEKCPANISEKKEIKFYLTIAKLGCLLFEENGGEVDTLTEALVSYGFVVDGDLYTELVIKDAGALVSAPPSIDLLRQMLSQHVIPEVLSSKAVFAELIQDDFSTVIPAGSLIFANNVEIDKGDLLLLNSGLDALLAAAHLLCATNIDMTRDELRMIVLNNKLEGLNTVLKKYSKFLTFDRVADNVKARSAVLRAIETYFAGSDYIRNGDSLKNPGAEELFSVSPEMELEEANFRAELNEVKSAMLDSRVATLRDGTRYDPNKILVHQSQLTPTVPRDLLPEIKEGFFVLDTVGNGLGIDSTLDGILPDATKQDWRKCFAKYLKEVYGFNYIGLTYASKNEMWYPGFKTDGLLGVGLMNNQLLTFTEIEKDSLPSYTEEAAKNLELVGLDHNHFYIKNNSDQLVEYDLLPNGQFSKSKTVLPVSHAFSQAIINGLLFKTEFKYGFDSDGGWKRTKLLVGYDLRLDDHLNKLFEIAIPVFNDYYEFNFCVASGYLYVVGSKWGGYSGGTTKVVAYSLKGDELGTIVGQVEFKGRMWKTLTNQDVMYCMGEDLAVLNISNPRDISIITRLKRRDAQFSWAASVQKFGNTLFVGGSPLVTAFDITNRNSPEFIAIMHNSDQGVNSRLMIKDGRAMVSTYRGLHQLDVRFFDADEDGLDDKWEQAHFNTLSFNGSQDFDNDGLLNKYEMVIGTNPKRADSDGDGMSDGWEYKYKLFPSFDDASLDMDGDGASNLEEFKGGANPFDKASIPAEPTALQPGVLMLLLDQ